VLSGVLEIGTKEKLFCLIKESCVSNQNCKMVCQTQLWCSIGIKAAGISLIWFDVALSGQAISQDSKVPIKFPVKALVVGQAKPDVLKDAAILPGIKFGPVTAKTTYQDLVTLLGAKRLVDVRPPDAADTEREFGTRVDLGSDWSFTVVWQDKTKMKPFEIIDMGPGWQIPGGLKIGMPMAELVKKLGPFEMVGLGGPYGGVIPLRKTLLQQHFGKMIVQMTPVPEADKKFPQAYKALEGERLIASTDPNWQALGMTVKYIIFPFPR
jgi:hypothetical protein